MALIFAIMFIVSLGALFATNLVSENIQNWTSRGSYATWTQAISVGTVNMTQCMVAPTGAASGTGTTGYVQMQASTGIIEIPALSSIGTIEFHIHAGGASRTAKIQQNISGTWTDVYTITGIGTTGATFTYNLNSATTAQIRLSTPSSAIYVHDIIITDYVTGSAPAAPVATAATSLLTNGFTANWNASSTATSYRLDVSTVNTFASYVSGYQDLTVNGLTQSVTGLNPSTTYYYRVRAVNTYGTSGNSNTITAVTADLPVAPDIPVAIAATNVASDGFTANWNAAAHADSYRLDVSTSNSFSSYVSGYQDLTVSGLSQAITGLSPVTDYYYRVRAYNTVGTSDNSNTITATTLAAPFLTEGFETSVTATPPTGWTLSSSGSYINIAAGSSHGGTHYAGTNALNGWISTPQIVNPVSMTFWARTSAASANFTLAIQYSSDNSNWTDATTFTATPTDAGTVTSTYSLKSVTLNLTGSYYIRWCMTARSGGSFYFDDVAIYANPPTTVPITVTSNITGAKIYRNSIDSGFTTPHIFDEEIADVVTYEVQSISTMVTPSSQEITVSEEETVTFTYTNQPSSTGGTSAVAAGAGSISVPATSGVTVTGNVTAPGLLVVTQVTPSAKGTYNGYLHVSTVYQVWTSDTDMLNGGSLSFAYTPTTPNYVAVHWGGANNGYYPVDHPETAGIPTPGYAFNGVTSQYGYNLGIAPFTGASYIGGVLTIAPIPTYSAKGPGVFEIILNGGDYDLPVELSSFTAVSATAQLMVTLNWTTESESNNLGFYVLRSEDSNISNAVNMNANIINGTNSSTHHSYSFQDQTVEAPQTYYYWLENVDYSGISRYTGPVMVNVLEQGDPNTPPVTPGQVTKLFSAYPNPFNPQTMISFELKTESDVSVQIFNVHGQLIKTLVNGHFTSGHYQRTWLGTDESGRNVGSGIYFYRMVAGKYISTQKVVLMK